MSDLAFSIKKFQTWSAAFILTPALACSVALNLVSIGFVLDDELRYRPNRTTRPIVKTRLIIKISMCIIQVGDSFILFNFPLFLLFF